MDSLTIDCVQEVLCYTNNPLLLFVSKTLHEVCNTNFMYKRWLELHRKCDLSGIDSNEWKRIYEYFIKHRGSYAIQTCNIPDDMLIVKVFLMDPNYTQFELNKIALNLLETGYSDAVLEMLDDKRIDPSFEYNTLIKKAAARGNLAVVDKLLNDSRVDPSACLNDPIRASSRLGHIDVVRRLLHDSRVDPSMVDNQAIIRASMYGHIEVVEELLRDPRVDPTAHDNYALVHAWHRGHVDVARRLLQDPRVHNTNIEALLEAGI